MDRVLDAGVSSRDMMQKALYSLGDSIQDMKTKQAAPNPGSTPPPAGAEVALAAAVAVGAASEQSKQVPDKSPEEDLEETARQLTAKIAELERSLLEAEEQLQEEIAATKQEMEAQVKALEEENQGLRYSLMLSSMQQVFMQILS
jgi:septin family protein